MKLRIIYGAVITAILFAFAGIALATTGSIEISAGKIVLTTVLYVVMSLMMALMVDDGPNSEGHPPY